MAHSLVPPPLAEIRRLIGGEDWDDTDFSPTKAYICSAFSELAYWYIPAFELAGHDRVKIVPSSAYEELQSRLQVDDLVAQIARSAELSVFTISSRLAVALVASTSQVIFVAIRGTADLYDKVIDAKICKRLGDSGTKFHRGFLAATNQIRRNVISQLVGYGTNIPVYVTGHSLGGAMAAILHATWNHRLPANLDSARQIVRVAYTFAMPRYTNRKGMYEQPYHVMNVKDLIPTLPSRHWGYADVQDEYILETLKPVAGAHRDSSRFGVSLLKLFVPSVKNRHKIESYRKALDRARRLTLV